MLEVIKTEKTFLMIRNTKGKLKHIEAHVTYSIEAEQDAPDFDYGNAEENARELARFKDGELLNVFLKVTVSALGETGVDTLGQVFVTARNLEADILNVAAEHDMKNNAARECINFIKYQYDTLKKALE